MDNMHVANVFMLGGGGGGGAACAPFDAFCSGGGPGFGARKAERSGSN